MKGCTKKTYGPSIPSVPGARSLPCGRPGATIIEKRDYLAVCLSDQIALGQRAGARWFTAGPISKRGTPSSPLPSERRAFESL